MHIPKLKEDHPPDSHLNLMFLTMKATPWSKPGHIITISQVQLTKPTPLQLLRALPSPTNIPKAELATPTLLSITNPRGPSWQFDLALGALTSWRPASPNRAENILTSPLLFDLYRAQTDNDRGCDFGRNWRDRRLHQAKPHPLTSSWRRDASTGTVTVVATTRIAPPVLNWACEIEATYTFTAADVAIRAHVKPTGPLLPRAWGRLGLVTSVAGCEAVRWYGRGSGEAYRDRKHSQTVGWWADRVDCLETEYEFPQENGNRADVRWVELLGRGGRGGPEIDEEEGEEEEEERGKRLLRARYGAWEGAGFSVLPYTAADLDKARHPFELRRMRREDRVVHLDWMHHGLGTGSCGPETLPEYTLDAGREYEVEVVLD